MALFFFSPRQKKKIKNKVWMLTQICHAIRVVVLLQIKTKKQKSECRTSPSELICTTLFFSPFRARRSDPSEGEKKKGQRLRFNPPRFHFSCNNKMYSKRGFFSFSVLVLRRRKAKNWRLKREKSKRREQPVVRESVIIIEVEGSGRNGFTVIFGLRVSQSDVTLDLRAAQKRPIFFYFLFSFSPPFSGSFHA